MGFLKKLLGGNERKDRPEKTYSDLQGVYLYVQCDHCGTPIRLRADKQYDLIDEEGGYAWHKTIVDNRCFRPMPTVVYFDQSYEMVSNEINGGHYITAAEYEALLAARMAAVAPPDDSAVGPETG